MTEPTPGSTPDPVPPVFPAPRPSDLRPSDPQPFASPGQQAPYGPPPQEYPWSTLSDTIQPKRRRTWLVVLAVVLVGLVGGVVWLSVSTKPAERAAPTEVTKTKVITSTDGRVQVGVPDDWAELPAKYRSPDAVLTYGQIFQERYLMVITDKTTDFDDFADFQVGVENLIRGREDQKVVSGPTALRLNGMAAVRYEVTMRVSGHPTVFWYTLVEGRRGYYQVIGWTLESARATSGPALDKVVDTFVEIR
ncbi:hypothetical protein [Actinokineospora inagensis]|uniref:hypothetical protein n=1 Tax=Actinokineospora inagensis TaxID=103730 RepID=UPI000422D83C|nr:hypothetical protein [Actinokineospora inagensis]